MQVSHPSMQQHICGIIRHITYLITLPPHAVDIVNDVITIQCVLGAVSLS